MGNGIPEVVGKHLENVGNGATDHILSFPMAGNERLICLLVGGLVASGGLKLQAEVSVLPVLGRNVDIDIGYAPSHPQAVAV
jgi:hypothetical protein